MAIEVTRICDNCGEKHKQIIDVDLYLDGEDFVCPVAFTCSSCILRFAQADELDALQAEQNEGRGVSCIQSIVFQIRKCDINCARRVYQLEGDKIRQYPEIQKWLYDHFGCRLHFKKHCDNWLCRKIAAKETEIDFIIGMEEMGNEDNL